MSKEKQMIEELADDIYTNCPACLLTEEAEMIARFVIEEQGYRKQREGEWVDQYQGKYDNQLYKCSECGETAFHDEKRWFLTHYCPNCGAKMKGGE